MLIEVEDPQPMEVPTAREVASEADWEARAHNKEIEIIQVLNVINPVATYITAGFDQYGNRFSPTLHEEWEDTQMQLGAAMALYEDARPLLERSLSLYEAHPSELAGLAARLRPGGGLIVAGVLESQVAELTSRLEGCRRITRP